MIYYIDIDNTICKTIGTNYNESKPYLERIKKINKLFDDGHKIIYWTSRGSASNIDWSELTKKQFKEWNVKYHELKFKKPIYDIFIDDKNINSDYFFKK